MCGRPLSVLGMLPHVKSGTTKLFIYEATREEVEGLGFRVQGLGFRVQGLGFRVQGLLIINIGVWDWDFIFDSPLCENTSIIRNIQKTSKNILRNIMKSNQTKTTSYNNQILVKNFMKIVFSHVFFYKNKPNLKTFFWTNTVFTSRQTIFHILKTEHSCLFSEKTQSMYRVVLNTLTL